MGRTLIIFIELFQIWKVFLKELIIFCYQTSKFQEDFSINEWEILIKLRRVTSVLIQLD